MQLLQLLQSAWREFGVLAGGFAQDLLEGLPLAGAGRTAKPLFQGAMRSVELFVVGSWIQALHGRWQCACTKVHQATG
jgi:hypothetical protein